MMLLLLLDVVSELGLLSWLAAPTPNERRRYGFGDCRGDSYEYEHG